MVPAASIRAPSFFASFPRSRSEPKGSSLPRVSTLRTPSAGFSLPNGAATSERIPAVAAT